MQQWLLQTLIFLPCLMKNLCGTSSFWKIWKKSGNTGANSIIMLEAYTSKKCIKNNHDNKTTWNTMGGQLITNKTGLVTFLLPEFNEFNLKKQICWVFHVDDCSESSSTYEMIFGPNILGELDIVLNFNDKTVTWDTDTIPMKDRGTLNPQHSRCPS
jgi:hypothetical protein